MGRKGTGVEVRETSIRLSFTTENGPQKKTLCINGQPAKPTQANIKYAHRVAYEIREKIKAGVFVMSEYFAADSSSPGLTVSSQLETYLGSLRVERSTLKGYMSAARFWSTTIGDKSMRTLKHSDALKALAARPMLSGKTIANYVSVLRDSLQLAVSDRVIAENPIGEIKAPHQKPPIDPFTKDEAEAIISDMFKHYPPAVGNYIETQFFTGLRTSEGIGLRWANVDLQSAHILVSEAVVNGHEKASTKTNRSRAVILNSRAEAAITRQKAHTLLEGGYVFNDPRRGLPWTKEQFFTRYYWLPTLKRLGIRYRRPYNTRHTYATMMLMAGMKPGFCAKQLGHSVKVFFSTYAKWIESEDDAREMGLLEASISPGSSLRKQGI